MQPIGLLILAACFVLAGCDRPVARVTPATARPVAEGVLHVLHDRRDSVYEWVFIVRGQTVFAQRHVFPGYTDPLMRVVGTLDTKSASSITPALTHPGDLKPPFQPHGPNLIRTDLGVTGAQAETVFFANDNQQVSAALAELRAAVTQAGSLVSDVPDWVRGNPEMLRAIGRGP
jgi:hypothetical protein